MNNKRALGIQVPNEKPQLVLLGDIVQSQNFERLQTDLPLCLGSATEGAAVCDDLKKMPHLLIAGATGTGKSVALNSIICSMLMHSTNDQLRFIMVDPKMLELSIYNGISHLLMPVITSPEKATSALKWAVYEMERRYQLMQELKVRNLESYNLSNKEKIPYIVIIIDELADLMLCAPKETEILIQRLAQKARASGIHMILATQRPSVDVITGVIKANLPARISFQVTTRHDSRTILDQNGAEKLLGRGDMLFMKPGQQKKLIRIQGSYIEDDEVDQFVNHLKKEPKKYDEKAMEWIEKTTFSDQNSSNKKTLTIIKTMTLSTKKL